MTDQNLLMVWQGLTQGLSDRHKCAWHYVGLPKMVLSVDLHTLMKVYEDGAIFVVFDVEELHPHPAVHVTALLGLFNG